MASLNLEHQLTVGAASAALVRIILLSSPEWLSQR
jgi:hypothetical protein